MDAVSEYWMRRIDAHMERGNAHMERSNELWERSNELWERANDLFDRNERAFDRFVEADERNKAAFERNTAAFERWEAKQDDMREFMREITLRVERTGREHSREIRRMGDELVKEIGAELRAVRGALLTILDRLEPGGSDSAA
jgi:hypothetical protein